MILPCFLFRRSARNRGASELGRHIFARVPGLDAGEVIPYKYIPTYTLTASRWVLDCQAVCTYLAAGFRRPRTLAQTLAQTGLVEPSSMRSCVRTGMAGGLASDLAGPILGRRWGLQGDDVPWLSSQLVPGPDDSAPRCDCSAVLPFASAAVSVSLHSQNC
jgi:hypothetical protein